jgi:hypothetical protein
MLFEMPNWHFKLKGKNFKVADCDLERNRYAVTNCDRIGNGTL